MAHIQPQKEFQTQTQELVIKRIRLCSLITMILVPLFSFLDIVLAPQHFKLFIILRLLTSSLIAVLFFLSWVPYFKKYPTLLGIIFLVVIGLPISAMTRFLGGYESSYYAGLNLIFLGMGLLIPWQLHSAVFAGALVYASYLIPILVLDHIKDWAIFINNNFFLSSTLLISLIATYVGHQYRWREFLSKKDQEEAYQKLQELDQAKTAFFANVSHELRTPLTLILAPMESLMKGHLGLEEAAQRGSLEIMYRNALRLLKLINNLLDLAKVDAGKMKLYLSPVDLNQFLRGIIASVEPMAQKKLIPISHDIEKELPQTFLDRDKLEKVILNLVFNSLKFTASKGEVKIICSFIDHQFKFSIEDTGIGISPQYLLKIFDRFSQADASATRKYEGTGIGMALAKEFVELHQGRIWVESELGKGTKVFFTLPHLTEIPDPMLEPEAKLDKRIAKVEVEEKKRDVDWTRELHQQALYHGEEKSAPLSSPDISTLAPKEKTLLLVEDNADMLNFLIFQLHGEYNLIKAADGVEGLQAAKTHHPDLIISDVMMPFKDGYELCQEIKQDPKIQHIPIILLTAKADLSMKITGLEYGADEYLTKPFSPEELNARIKSLLNSKKLEREIQLRSQALEQTLKELKSTQAQLVQSAKMASIGQLAAGIAHEMNNPLTFVTSSLHTLERLSQKMKEAETSQDIASRQNFFENTTPILERMSLGLKRTKSIIDDLMNFARKDVESPKEEDLNEGIHSVLTLLNNRISDKVKIHVQLGDIPKVECVLGQVNQVLMNLLINSLDALHENGEIWISTVPQNSHVEICIRDNGEGIPKEVQARLFEPFFTTKDVGKGVGLGLSISHKIIENHHGSIDFKSEKERGTEFLVKLPVRQSQKWIENHKENPWKF